MTTKEKIRRSVTRTFNGDEIINKKTNKLEEPIGPQMNHQKHNLPAVLSFFVPSLGQFIKGQVNWGLTLWVWFIIGNIFITILSGIFGSLSILLFLAFNFFLWVYQIYDAYNAPQEEH